jgi:hypothetical protein
MGDDFFSSFFDADVVEGIGCAEMVDHAVRERLLWSLACDLTPAEARHVLRRLMPESPPTADAAALGGAPLVFETVTLHVNQMNGSRATYRISTEETVLEVKRRLEREFGFATNRQKLFCPGLEGALSNGTQLAALGPSLQAFHKEPCLFLIVDCRPHTGTWGPLKGYPKYLHAAANVLGCAESPGYCKDMRAWSCCSGRDPASGSCCACGRAWHLVPKYCEECNPALADD